MIPAGEDLVSILFLSENTPRHSKAFIYWDSERWRCLLRETKKRATDGETWKEIGKPSGPGKCVTLENLCHFRALETSWRGTEKALRWSFSQALSSPSFQPDVKDPELSHSIQMWGAQPIQLYRAACQHSFRTATSRCHCSHSANPF